MQGSHNQATSNNNNNTPTSGQVNESQFCGKNYYCVLSCSVDRRCGGAPWLLLINTLSILVFLLLRRRPRAPGYDKQIVYHPVNHGSAHHCWVNLQHCFDHQGFKNKIQSRIALGLTLVQLLNWFDEHKQHLPLSVGVQAWIYSRKRTKQHNLINMKQSWPQVWLFERVDSPGRVSIYSDEPCCFVVVAHFRGSCLPNWLMSSRNFSSSYLPFLLAFCVCAQPMYIPTEWVTLLVGWIQLKLPRSRKTNKNQTFLSNGSCRFNLQRFQLWKWIVLSCFLCTFLEFKWYPSNPFGFCVRFLYSLFDLDADDDDCSGVVIELYISN